MNPRPPEPAPLSSAHNRLWLPSLALAGCVRAALLRNTLGVPFTPAQGYTHFAATPLLSLSWWFHGSVTFTRGLATGPRQGQSMPGRFVLGGPFTGPGTSYSDGPGHGMMLMLMPDAVQRLTGINPAALVNQLVDAAQVLPPDWLALCETVQACSNDDERLAHIEAFLLPRWHATAADRGAVRRYEDWSQGVALRAANSPLGRSLRQLERRIKHWTGLPLRELRGLSRAEKTFFQVLEAADAGPVNWADMAQAGGYTDQSHLCREVRRITGFSPEALRQRIEHDEAMWVYRLWL